MYKMRKDTGKMMMSGVNEAMRDARSPRCEVRIVCNAYQI